MTTLHINAILLAFMLFVIQLAGMAMLFFSAAPMDSGHENLFGYLMGGNGNSTVELVDGLMLSTMFAPMAGLIYTMKWFAGIHLGSKEDKE